MELIWDQAGERFYETGVKKGVLYPQNAGGLYPLGIAWNGLTAVTESPSGAEASPIYADDIKYANIMSAEEFSATIEAYTYPDEFEACDGSAELADGVIIGQQKRTPFGLVYQSSLGNDIDGLDYGYKLHLVYGAVAAPSEKGFQTINDSPEAITFSWEVSTTAVAVTGKKPTASLAIDSTKADPTQLAALEAILFGSVGIDPRLPLPDEVATLFAGTGPDALVLSTIVPDDEAASIAKTANIVITFNNKIMREGVVISSAAGEIVEGIKTWDAEGKILTFNPTVDLTGTTTYLVAVGGVTDIYGQTLAPVVKNFTTIA